MRPNGFVTYWSASSWKPANLVRLLASRGQDEHGRLTALGAQGPQDLIAVDAGQHEIEDDEVGVPLARERESGVAVVRNLHGVSLELEVVAQPLREVVRVLDRRARGS